MPILPMQFYSRPTLQVARDLIGARLVRSLEIDGRQVRLAGIIVETEAYGGSDDPASHARMGQTRRNAVMFGPVGVAYVYFTYGAHYCVNVSARSEGRKAGAVLVRALEPVEGADFMKQNRDRDEIMALTCGPANLAKALSIGPGLNGCDMTSPDSGIFIEGEGQGRKALSTTRVGITRAADRMWRFIDPSSRYVSRKAIIKTK